MSSKTNPCEPGKILNPKTNKCVKIDGAIGKALVAAEAAATKRGTTTKAAATVATPNSDPMSSPKAIKDFCKKLKNTSTAFKPYPDYEDEQFSEKIRRKKEFVLSRKQYDPSGTIDPCSKKLFTLSYEQRFLRTFIHPDTPYRSVLLYHGVGVGKCFGLGTRILMHDGSVEFVENIKMGDRVMGDDSTPRRVTSVVVGKSTMYRIVPEFGTHFDVNGEHVLCLIDTTNHFRKVQMTVNEYLAQKDKTRYIGYRSKLTFFPKLDRDRDHQDTLTVSSNRLYDLGFNYVPIVSAIPAFVKLGFPSVRASFLAGYIDRYGTLSEDGSSILLPFDTDVYFMLGSIGINIHDESPLTISIFGSALRRLPLRLVSTKKILCCETSFKFFVMGAGVNSYYGFSVDKNHQFLLGDFTVTHNSCATISIAENFDFPNKTLVLLPASLIPSFRKQILNETLFSANQCTGNKYVSRLSASTSPLTMDFRRQEADALIDEKYEFMGFQKFANQENISLSNRVVIVDEAHNMRDDVGESAKQAPPALLEALKIAENTALIMCTATPMYDKASEINTLFNYLLANDKRELLSSGEDIDEEAITTLSENYVSYVKGENKHAFPKRIYSKDSRPYETPTLDMKGAPIRACKLPQGVVASIMSDEQYACSSKSVKQSNNTDESETRLRQLANVFYPPVGEFRDVFESIGDKDRQFQYKSRAIRILDPDHIQTYAPKIKRIVDTIEKTEGITYVYSFFKPYGIIPLAVALESAGFSSWDHTPVLPRDKFKPKKQSYAILNNEDPIAFNKIIAAAVHENNQFGEHIKVLIGTSTSAEGLDLKNVRHIHILDPWYHNNKAEQIIGRGVRNCSHMLLPPQDRNVTIYRHMIVNPPRKGSKETETIDYKMFRTSQEKQISIDHVLNLLQTHNLSTGWTSEQVPESSTFRTCFFETMASTQIFDAFDQSAQPKATFEQLKKRIPSISPEELCVTLDRMIQSRMVGYVGNAKYYLIYCDRHYILQPAHEKDLRISISERKTYAEPKQRILYGLKIEAELGPTGAVAAALGAMGEIEQQLLDAKCAFAQLGIVNSNYDQEIIDFVVDRLSDPLLFHLIKSIQESKHLDTRDRELKQSLIRGHYIIESKGDIKAWRNPRTKQRDSEHIEILDLERNLVSEYVYQDYDKKNEPRTDTFVFKKSHPDQIGMYAYKRDKDVGAFNVWELGSKTFDGASFSTKASHTASAIVTIIKNMSDGDVAQNIEALTLKDSAAHVHIYVKINDYIAKITGGTGEVVKNKVPSKTSLCDLYELLMRKEKTNFLRPIEYQTFFKNERKKSKATAVSKLKKTKTSKL